MGWEALEPSERVDAARWIAERLHPFARDVGSIVPAGFEAYARIFHPAWRHAGWPLPEVRWATVAASSGRIVHPEMQFHSIAAPVPGREAATAAWDGEPRLGVLPRGQVEALVGPLGANTSVPDRCWFCLWEGYGYLHPGGIAPLTAFRIGSSRPPPPPPRPRPRQTRGRVQLPARVYLLFTGSVAQAAGWEDGPNLWWPDDRAWCVASEIDFPYTYVGGSRRLIEEVLANPLLEALQSALHHGINANSDRVNST